MTTKLITAIPMALVCIFLFSAFTLQSNYQDNGQSAARTEGAVIEEHQAAFDDFLGVFQEASMPFKMTLEDFKKDRAFLKQSLTESKGKQTRSNAFKSVDMPERFIPELKERGFSRMGPMEIEPIVKITMQEDLIAVLYKSYRSRYATDRYEIKMMVYNQSGEIVSLPFVKHEKQRQRILKHKEEFYNPIVLGWNSRHDLQTFQLDKNGWIKMKYWEIQYEKDRKKYGTHDNPIVGHDLIENRYIQIEADGSFKRVKAEELDKC